MKTLLIILAILTVLTLASGLPRRKVKSPALPEPLDAETASGTMEEMNSIIKNFDIVDHTVVQDDMCTEPQHIVAFLDFREVRQNRRNLNREMAYKYAEDISGTSVTKSAVWAICNNGRYSYIQPIIMSHDMMMSLKEKFIYSKP
ncbi:MAG: hypothetical protein IJ504_00675 [Bacteroidales bacterium]|nr:hypothetical protein [Bacteroidales bacterium]